MREAISLDRVLEAHFEDQRTGGFFLTGDDHERLLVRERPSYDGAEPSGNSVQILNLLRLHELTMNGAYERRGKKALAALGGTFQRAPAALSEALLAVDFVTCKAKEVVIVTHRSREEAEPLLARFRAIFLPNRVLLVVGEGRPLRELSRVVPLVEGKVAAKRQPMAYVCRRGICDLPTSDPAVFEKQIRQVEPLPAAAAK